jgi:hypothetical protein
MELGLVQQPLVCDALEQTAGEPGGVFLSDHLPHSLTRWAAAMAVLFAMLLTGCGSTSPHNQDCADLVANNERVGCIAGGADAAHPIAAVRNVEAEARQKPKVALVCHQAMHRFAARISRPSKTLINQAVHLKGACASGFVHGIFERSIEHAGTQDTSTAVEVCEQLWSGANGDPLPARECFHGLGHGFRRRIQSATASLDACDEAIPEADAQLKCYGGVFMEGQFTRVDPTIDSALKRSPCVGLRGTRAAACYAFSAGFDGDPLKAAQWCDSAPNDDARLLCLASFGRTLPVAEFEQCAQFDDGESVDACFAGLLRGEIYEAQLLTVAQAQQRCATVTRPYNSNCSAQLTALFAPGKPQPRVDSMDASVV